MDIGLALAISMVVQLKEIACSGSLFFFFLQCVVFSPLCHMCWQCPFMYEGI